jgi:ParB family chromosome partitioning protein
MAAPSKPPPSAAPPGPDVRDIPLDQIHLGKQPRERFEAGRMAELAESLRTVGQLTPVRVRPRAGGGYDLVFGERRVRAAKDLGWAAVRAEVAAGDPTPAELLHEQLAENLARADFQPVERARGFRRLMDLRGWSGKQLAAAFALSEAAVSQALRLLDLHPELQEAIDAGRVTASAGYDLAKRPPEEQQAAARQAVAGKPARGAAKGNPGKRPPLRLSLPGNHFDFEVVGNRITVKGKEIDSARLLNDVLAELVAAVRAHLRSAEAASPPAGAAKPKTSQFVPNPDPSDPDGRASA